MKILEYIKLELEENNEMLKFYTSNIEDTDEKVSAESLIKLFNQCYADENVIMKFININDRFEDETKCVGFEVKTKHGILYLTLHSASNDVFLLKLDDIQYHYQAIKEATLFVNEIEKIEICWCCGNPEIEILHKKVHEFSEKIRNDKNASKIDELKFLYFNAIEKHLINKFAI